MAFLLLFHALFAPAFAHSSVNVSLWMLEDKTAALTVEQIIQTKDSEWQRIDAERTSFGMSSSRFWFKFDVPEKDLRFGENEPLLIEVTTAYIGKLDLYSVLDGKIVSVSHTGLSVPVSKRPHDIHRSGFPVFRLPAPRNPRTEYFISMEGPLPLLFPMKLWEAPEFPRHEWIMALIAGIFVGALLIAGFTNGFLALSLKSRLYANYSLFILSMLWIALSSSGLSVQLFWPESPWWAMREMHVIGGISLLFYTFFIREFIGSKIVSPKLDAILIALVGLNLLRSLWMIFELNVTVGFLGVLVSAATNIVVLVIAILALRHGDRPVRYFFYASLTFNCAITLFLLQEMKLIWFSPLAPWFPFLGTLVEIVLLGMALGDRIRQTNFLLAEQKAATIQADKLSALGRMAGEIAHEISNPLAVIHGNAVLIREQLEGKAHKPLDLSQLANSIETTAIRISKTVKGMRSLARDSRKDPFQSTAVSSILQDSLAVCRDRIQNSGARFEAPEPLPELRLKCRGSEINQVLVNLLCNAFDAVEGRPEAWVKVGIEPKGSMVEISVLDNGLGVPREHRQKILEPFFTTKEPGKGLGLGLSISRTIVESHGGQLWLDETAPHTRFAFTLPVSKEN